MNQQEKADLLSQRSTLERMIANTPATAIIDLRTLKARLDTINHQLAKYSKVAVTGKKGIGRIKVTPPVAPPVTPPVKAQVGAQVEAQVEAQVGVQSGVQSGVQLVVQSRQAMEQA